jgi:hypothetical protein
LLLKHLIATEKSVGLVLISEKAKLGFKELPWQRRKRSKKQEA